jgi:hypothetical protein
VHVEATPQALRDAGRFYGEHAALSERLYKRYSEAQLEFLLHFVREAREFNELQAVQLEQQNRAPARSRGGGRGQGRRN